MALVLLDAWIASRIMYVLMPVRISKTARTMGMDLLEKIFFRVAFMLGACSLGYLVWLMLIKFTATFVVALCSQHFFLCNGFGYITVVEISLLSEFSVFFFEEKGELLTEKARYGG